MGGSNPQGAIVFHNRHKFSSSSPIFSFRKLFPREISRRVARIRSTWRDAPWCLAHTFLFARVCDWTTATRDQYETELIETQKTRNRYEAITRRTNLFHALSFCKTSGFGCAVQFTYIAGASSGCQVLGTTVCFSGLFVVCWVPNEAKMVNSQFWVFGFCFVWNKQQWVKGVFYVLHHIGGGFWFLRSKLLVFRLLKMEIWFFGGFQWKHVSTYFVQKCLVWKRKLHGL